MDFFAGAISVFHFLYEHLLADPVDFVIFLDEFLVESGDFLFQEGSLIDKFGDGHVLGLNLVRNEVYLRFSLVEFVLDVRPFLFSLLDFLFDVLLLLFEFGNVSVQLGNYGVFLDKSHFVLLYEQLESLAFDVCISLLGIDPVICLLQSHNLVPDGSDFSILPDDC